MKNGIIYKLFMIGFILSGYCSCSEYEMIKFSESPAINFWGRDKYGVASDDPATLYSVVNFAGKLNNFNAAYDTLQVGIKLEGANVNKPLRVRLKASAVDQVIFPELILSDTTYMPADTNMTVLKVIVKRPEILDTVYQAILEFDYGNSDVAAGTKERQKYELKIRDEVTFNMLGISQSTWDNYYKPKVGVYGEVKIRFMASALGGYYLANGITSSKLKKLRTALSDYNEQHPDHPLKEKNGDLISFDPA